MNHVTGSSAIENNNVYAHLQGKGSNVAELIWHKGANDSCGSWGNMPRKNNVGNAPYFVIKMRTNAHDIGAFGVYISTESKNTVKKINIPINSNKSDDWTVYVINLAELASDCYAKSDDGNYIVDTLYFLTDSTITAEQYIDIEYMAFVEDWSGIDAIVDEATVYQITNADGTAAEVKADGTEISAG